MERATISFPEPVSPVISTLAVEGATISTCRMTSCIAPDDPTRVPSFPASRSCRVSAATACWSRTRPSARSSSARNTGGFSGFSMYQNAPASIACTTRSSLPRPVMMITGIRWISSPR